MFYYYKSNFVSSSFSEDSLPAVSHPDQEFDWSIQTEAALMSSVAATAHQLSGAYIEHTQADAVRQLHHPLLSKLIIIIKYFHK